MAQEHHSTQHDVRLEITRWPKLEEQTQRLQAAGDDPTCVDYWHPNALMAAADFLELGRADRVSSNAIMVALSLLTTQATPRDLDVTLPHSDGVVARLAVRFGAQAVLPEAAPSSVEGKRLWAEKTSVDPATIQSLVDYFADATESKPGAVQSIVGVGAILALVQALDTMNGQRYEVALNGLGDSEAKHDVKVRLTLEAPAPVAKRNLSP